MLTTKQLRLFTVIKTHIEQTGRSPTYRDMADRMGVTNTAAYRMVQAIIARGLLSKLPGRANGVALVRRDYYHPTTDGHPWVTYGDSA